MAKRKKTARSRPVVVGSLILVICGAFYACGQFANNDSAPSDTLRSGSDEIIVPVETYTPIPATPTEAPLPTDTPVPATPTEAAIPTDTPIPPTPTEAPLPLALEVVNLTSPIVRGSNATLEISTEPGSECWVVVEYKSGPSSAEGLEHKVATDGRCSWLWDVGPRTTPGEWSIYVRVQQGSRVNDMDIPFVVTE